VNANRRTRTKATRFGGATKTKSQSAMVPTSGANILMALPARSSRKTDYVSRRNRLFSAVMLGPQGTNEPRSQTIKFTQ
jgi:hypothetical protein